VQEFPGAVVMVDSEGNPAGRLAVGGTDGGMFSLTGCDAAGDHFLLSGSRSELTDGAGVQARTYFLSSVAPDGQESHRYAETKGAYNYADFTFTESEHMPMLWWCFAAGADGRTYVAPDRDSYRIEVYAPDGRPELVIEREYEAPKRTEREYRNLVNMIETALSGLPFEATIVAERTTAAVAYMQRGIRVRDNGEIWALSGRGVRDQPEGVMATFDVFDHGGEFVRTVSLAGPDDGFADGVFFVGDDRVVVVKGYVESLAAQFGNGSTYSADDDSPESPYVICYEMVRP